MDDTTETIATMDTCLASVVTEESVLVAGVDIAANRRYASGR